MIIVYIVLIYLFALIVTGIIYIKLLKWKNKNKKPVYWKKINNKWERKEK